MPSPTPHEILPGVLHWTTVHEAIDAPVSSHAVAPAGIVIDPRVPDGGMQALAGWPAPRQVVLTSAHHARHAELFAEEYGIPVATSRQAAERLRGALAVQTFEGGDEVAPGVTAIAVGILSPDEYALHLDVGEGAIAVADGVHRYGGELGFFPDHLLGDDPQAVKDGLRDAFRALLDRPFDHLLLAHGDPLVGGAKEALRAWTDRA